jgi:hypothetical protein
MKFYRFNSLGNIQKEGPAVLIALTMFLYGCSRPANAALSAQQALTIAQNQKEVEALYLLGDGVLKDCLLSKVERSCDSDWVSCIDEAWVVSYRLRPDCPVKGDERLGITLLIDGKDGQVISHFPELAYFQQPQFCMEDYDCTALLPEATAKNASVSPVFFQEKGECYNFIFAPLYRMNAAESRLESKDPFVACVCRDQRCERG